MRIWQNLSYIQNLHTKVSLPTSFSQSTEDQLYEGTLRHKWPIENVSSNKEKNKMKCNPSFRHCVIFSYEIFAKLIICVRRWRNDCVQSMMVLYDVTNPSTLSRQYICRSSVTYFNLPKTQSIHVKKNISLRKQKSQWIANLTKS